MTRLECLAVFTRQTLCICTQQPLNVTAASVIPIALTIWCEAWGPITAPSAKWKNKEEWTFRAAYLKDKDIQKLCVCTCAQAVNHCMPADHQTFNPCSPGRGGAPGMESTCHHSTLYSWVWAPSVSFNLNSGALSCFPFLINLEVPRETQWFYRRENLSLEETALKIIG